LFGSVSTVEDGDVEVAVAIEVARGQRDRRGADRVVVGIRERPPAVAMQHAHRRSAGDDDVEVAVFVDVEHRDGRGSGGRTETDHLGEAHLAGVDATVVTRGLTVGGVALRLLRGGVRLVPAGPARAVLAGLAALLFAAGRGLAVARRALGFAGGVRGARVRAARGGIGGLGIT